MVTPKEVSEKKAQEWLEAVQHLCSSTEIRELMWKLEKEHHVYPQTVLTIEEE